MLYEIQKTANYRFQYGKLSLRFKRFVDDAIDILKENPTEYQNKITHIGNKRDSGLYRYRIPGCYLLYVIPFHPENGVPTIILTSLKLL